MYEKTNRELLLSEGSAHYSTDLHKASARLNDSILKTYLDNQEIDPEEAPQMAKGAFTYRDHASNIKFRNRKNLESPVRKPNSVLRPIEMKVVVSPLHE
jgi:hypothetical protein